MNFTIPTNPAAWRFCNDEIEDMDRDTALELAERMVVMLNDRFPHMQFSTTRSSINDLQYNRDHECVFEFIEYWAQPTLQQIYHDRTVIAEEIALESMQGWQFVEGL